MSTDDVVVRKLFSLYPDDVALLRMIADEDQNSMSATIRKLIYKEAFRRDIYAPDTSKQASKQPA